MFRNSETQKLRNSEIQKFTTNRKQIKNKHWRFCWCFVGVCGVCGVCGVYARQLFEKAVVFIVDLFDLNKLLYTPNQRKTAVCSCFQICIRNIFNDIQPRLLQFRRERAALALRPRKGCFFFFFFFVIGGGGAGWFIHFILV